MKRTLALFGEVLVTVTLLGFVPAMAQRTGVAQGAGMEVCEQVLVNIKDGHVDKIYTEWVVGYISACNLFSEQKQVKEIPDEATMEAYLQRYCRDKPLDKVIWASMYLISELGGYRPPYMQK